MERLTEYMGNGEDYESINPIDTPYEYGKANLQSLINKLAAYEDAEEQGLLLRLPCKVGDTVYKVDRVSNKIKQHKVVKFEVGRAVDQVDFENFDYCFLHHFGKTVFLTKSEAEAKLKEMI